MLHLSNLLVIDDPLFVDNEEQCVRSHLAHERHHEALIESEEAFPHVDVFESSAYSFVLWHQVEVLLAVVTYLACWVLWKRVLMSSKGWRILVTNVEQADAMPQRAECMLSRTRSERVFI